MGELKIQYSDKKVSPFGGMKLLKDFIDTTNIIKDLESVNLTQPQSNAGINPIDIIQGFSQRECKHKGWQYYRSFKIYPC